MLVIDTGAHQNIVVKGTAHRPGPGRPRRSSSRCWSTGSDPDPWDADANGVLDAFAGHGTFIAGIFANLAPGCSVYAERGLSSFGDTDDAAIARTLYEHFARRARPRRQYDIVNMSFGGFCEDDDPPVAIAKAIATIQARHRTVPKSTTSIQERVVFVASAGNSASCRPTWPASFENVIGVGALGPNGPAAFTNYGPWVDACAPGVDVVSCFFDLAEDADVRRRRLRRLGTWSGTSFAGPVVAASIAWEWMCRKNDGAPGEPRVADGRATPYPLLGTVVNAPERRSAATRWPRHRRPTPTLLTVSPGHPFRYRVGARWSVAVV